MNDKGMRWFDVTVVESYTAPYKVLAHNRQEAVDLVNGSIDCGDTDPTADAVDSYDRDVSVEEGNPPEQGDSIIRKEENDGD